MNAALSTWELFLNPSISINYISWNKAAAEKTWIKFYHIVYGEMSGISNKTVKYLFTKLHMGIIVTTPMLL